MQDLGFTRGRSSPPEPSTDVLMTRSGSLTSSTRLSLSVGLAFHAEIYCSHSLSKRLWTSRTNPRRTYRKDSEGLCVFVEAFPRALSSSFLLSCISSL